MVNIKIYNNKNDKYKIIPLMTVYIFLLFGAFIMLIPFVWMLSSSLKNEKDVFAFPIQWIPTVAQWSNYKVIWEKVPLLTGFVNSKNNSNCYSTTNTYINICSIFICKAKI